MDKRSAPQASATAKASLFKDSVKNPQRPLKTAEIDILRAKAEGWLTPLGLRVLVRIKKHRENNTVNVALSDLK